MRGPPQPPPLLTRCCIPRPRTRPRRSWILSRRLRGVKVRLPTRDDGDGACATRCFTSTTGTRRAPQRTVLALATNTTRSHTVRLPGVVTSCSSASIPGFTSPRMFDRGLRDGRARRVARGARAAAPAVAEGAYAQMSAGDWAVWFRRVQVRVHHRGERRSKSRDPAMSPCAFRRRERRRRRDDALLAGAAPPRTFEPNEHGYTIMAYSKALSLSAGRWRLSALADVPFASFEETPAETPATLRVRTPNYSHLVCRLRVAVSARALLAFHFETDLPSGLTVTLTDPEEGWETKQAEYLRGGHRGHLRGEELRRWDAYAALTVPVGGDLSGGTSSSR